MSYLLLHTSDYKDYFESLVARANFLDQFYYTYDEMKSKATKEKGIKFVLEPYDNAIAENQNDNVLSTRKGMFVILQPYSSNLGNSLAEAQNAAELLCYKVLGQMKRDSRAHLLRAEITGYQGMEIAPVMAGYAGYSIEFNFQAPINSLMKYLPEDWNE